MTKHFNIKCYKDIATIFAYSYHNNYDKAQLTNAIIALFQRDNPKFSIQKFDKYIEKIIKQLEEYDEKYA